MESLDRKKETCRLLDLMLVEIRALKEDIYDYNEKQQEQQEQRKNIKELFQRLGDLEFRVSLVLNPLPVVNENNIKISSKTLSMLDKLCQLELSSV